MSLLKYILMAMLSISLLLSGCSKGKTEMKIEDYVKIENEIGIPDPELDPAKVKTVAEKYGFTLEQYKQFHQKVQTDPALKEKLGELTLKKQK